MILDIEHGLLMEAKSLIKQLDLDLGRLQVWPDTGATLCYESDIEAEEFLRFAEQDLALGERHGLVNALSNAKRAIDCQVDKVLGCFGLQSRKNFPQKLELLRGMGIVAPRIVNKVVKARNYLEHEYKAPEREQVEDAVDIATLFVISLDRVLHFFPQDYEVGTAMENEFDEFGEQVLDKFLSVSFDSEHQRYVLAGYVYQESESGKRPCCRTGNALLSPGDDGYLEVIRLSARVENENVRNAEAVRFITFFLRHPA